MRFSKDIKEHIEVEKLALAEVFIDVEKYIDKDFLKNIDQLLTFDLLLSKFI